MKAKFILENMNTALQTSKESETYYFHFLIYTCSLIGNISSTFRENFDHATKHTKNIIRYNLNGIEVHTFYKLFEVEKQPVTCKDPLVLAK